MALIRLNGAGRASECESLDDAFTVADWFVCVCRLWLDQPDLKRAYAVSLARHLAHLVAAADRLDRLRFQLIRCEKWAPGETNHAPFEPIMPAYSEFCNELEYVVGMRICGNIFKENMIRDLQSAARKAAAHKPFRLTLRDRARGDSSVVADAEDERWVLVACELWLDQPDLDLVYSAEIIESVQQLVEAARLLDQGCGRLVQLIIGMRTSLNDDPIDPVIPLFVQYRRRREGLQLDIMASARAAEVFFKSLEDSAREAAARNPEQLESAGPYRAELKVVHRRR